MGNQWDYDEDWDWTEPTPSSFTGSNSWDVPLTDDGRPDFSGGRTVTQDAYVPEGGVYAGEEYYDPTSGVQKDKAPTGMSSSGLAEDEVTQYEEQRQLGGALFDWSEYTPSTGYERADDFETSGRVTRGAPSATFGTLPAQDKIAPTATPTAIPPIAPAATPIPIVPPEGQLNDIQQSFLDKYGKTIPLPKTVPGQAGGSIAREAFQTKWVLDNWDTIQSIQDLLSQPLDAYGNIPGGRGKFPSLDTVFGYIGMSAKDPEFDFKGGWKDALGMSGDDWTRSVLGNEQRKVLDYWAQSGGFHGKMFNNKDGFGTTIAGRNDIPATSWEGVLQWFEQRHPDIPQAVVLADLHGKAQHWPRTSKQGRDIGEILTSPAAPKIAGAAPPGPQLAGEAEANTVLQGRVSIIGREFVSGQIQLSGLKILLLDEWAKSQFPGQQWEDKPITWQAMQAYMEKEGKSMGGLDMNVAELWALDMVDSMIAAKEKGSAAGIGFTPVPGVASFSGGQSWKVPTTLEDTRAIMDSMGPDDPNYGAMWELMNTFIDIEQGTGGGVAGDRDLQEKYLRALTDIHALKTTADITAERNDLLTAWEKELQGESMRLRGVEAGQIGVQQQLERDRMTGETTGQIGGAQTYESRLFDQRAAQETAAAGRAGTLAQTAAEAEASRLKVAEGGVESQAQQAQAATDQVANTYKIAEATLTGLLGTKQTLENKQLGYVQALKEAELSGTLWEQMGTDKDLPGYAGVKTMAMRTFALNESIAEDKMALERQIQLAASRREDSRLNSEQMRMQNQTFIERGQLAEAVQSRREMNRIKEAEMEDARNTMRLNTLMSLMNPVAMLMAQRMGMIPQLEAAMGIDLDIPEIPSMLPDGMNVPTAQMLNLFSPQDQQLIMAESSFRTGLSPDDVQSVIHRQRPGAPGGALRTFSGGR